VPLGCALPATPPIRKPRAEVAQPLARRVLRWRCPLAPDVSPRPKPGRTRSMGLGRLRPTATDPPARRDRSAGGVHSSRLSGYSGLPFLRRIPYQAVRRGVPPNGGQPRGTRGLAQRRGCVCAVLAKRGGVLGKCWGGGRDIEDVEAALMNARFIMGLICVY